MKRENFIQIIKLRSFWKIDRRKGNYKLPNGKKLDTYVMKLVETQMQLDGLGIRENGDLTSCVGGGWNTETKYFNDYIVMIPYQDNEICSYDNMERRIRSLVNEIIGC